MKVSAEILYFFFYFNNLIAVVTKKLGCGVGAGVGVEKNDVFQALEANLGLEVEKTEMLESAVEVK